VQRQPMLAREEAGKQAQREYAVSVLLCRQA
jgi:hypothetical protein